MIDNLDDLKKYAQEVFDRIEEKDALDVMMVLMDLINLLAEKEGKEKC